MVTSAAGAIAGKHPQRCRGGWHDEPAGGAGRARPTPKSPRCPRKSEQKLSGPARVALALAKRNAVRTHRTMAQAAPGE